MKKLKEEKGIMLVALIITIVVLLILAAVAIGTVRDSNIIGHAQNAAGSYNQAKANEVDALTKYVEELEKYAPGEKKEYIGNLRLNTKYYPQGIENPDEYIIFYSDGTVFSYYAYLTPAGTREEFENNFEYTIEDNIIEFDGMRYELVKLESNELLVTGDGQYLYSTSTNGLNYLESGEYRSGDEVIILKEDGYEVPGIIGYGAPILYEEIIYPTGNYYAPGDDVPIEYMTSTDNGETIQFRGKVYTKVIK